MPKERRFDSKLQTWVPSEYAEAVEQLAKDQLLDGADIVRQAVVWYLRNHGFVPPVPQANGHLEDRVIT